LELDKNMKIKNKILSVVAMALPVFCFSAPSTIVNDKCSIDTFKQLVYCFVDVVNTYIVFGLIGLSTIIFLWGIAEYLRNPGAEKDLEKIKNKLIWGVVGLTVALSFWGLVALLVSAFGIGGIVKTSEQNSNLSSIVPTINVK
jgi:hypothetical protein